jgi:hypothetical protein
VGLDVRLMCDVPMPCALCALMWGSACSMRAAVSLPRSPTPMAALHAVGRPGRGVEGVGGGGGGEG